MISFLITARHSAAHSLHTIQSACYYLLSNCRGEKTSSTAHQFLDLQQDLQHYITSFRNTLVEQEGWDYNVVPCSLILPKVLQYFVRSFPYKCAAICSEEGDKEAINLYQKAVEQVVMAVPPHSDARVLGNRVWIWPTDIPWSIHISPMRFLSFPIHNAYMYRGRFFVFSCYCYTQHRVTWNYKSNCMQTLHYGLQCITMGVDLITPM